MPSSSSSSSSSWSSSPLRVLAAVTCVAMLAALFAADCDAYAPSKGSGSNSNSNSGTARRLKRLFRATVEEKSDAGVEVEGDAEAEAESESSYDIYGGGLKDKLHEKIATNALRTLGADGARSFDESYLHRGVRANDMPSGEDNNFLALIPFGIDFKGQDTHTIVWNSHYGCMQQWHSMAPAFTPGHVDGKGDVTNVLFTQTDVRRLIRTQLKFMWQRAIDEKANKNSVSFWAGRMLHVLADSYAGGHVVRGWLRAWHGRDHVDPFRNVNDFDAQELKTLATGGYCGWVLYFQGYGAQHANDEHGELDHDPTDVIKGRSRTDKALRARGIKCATSANFMILDALHKCLTNTGSCFFDQALKPAFKEWYRVSLPMSIAGGSVAAMADPHIASNAKYAAVDIAYTDLMGKRVDTKIWAPRFETSQTKAEGEWMWAEMPPRTPICPTDMTARSGLLYKKNKWFDFHNSNPGYTDPLHSI